MWHVRGWLRNIEARLIDWRLRKHFGVTAQEIHGCRCNRHAPQP